MPIARPTDPLVRTTFDISCGEQSRPSPVRLFPGWGTGFPVTRIL
jgi:hypothetical protein